MVKKNIGRKDRFLRLSMALVLFVLAWVCGSWLLLAGAVFTLYEALAGWCVFYAWLGKSSCGLSDRDK